MGSRRPEHHQFVGGIGLEREGPGFLVIEPDGSMSSVHACTIAAPARRRYRANVLARNHSRMRQTRIVNYVCQLPRFGSRRSEGELRSPSVQILSPRLDESLRNAGAFVQVPSPLG